MDYDREKLQLSSRISSFLEDASSHRIFRNALGVGVPANFRKEIEI